MPGIRLAIAAAVAMLAFAGAATAQTVRTPGAGAPRDSPGGVTDTMARIAQRLTEQLGCAVIVDNRAGGNGSACAIAVSMRRPTVSPCWSPPTPPTTANPSLSSKLGYSAKDFTPIIVLVPRAGAGGQRRGAREHRQRAHRAGEGQACALNYGFYGVGTYASPAWRNSSSAIGTDIVHIPYRG